MLKKKWNIIRGPFSVAIMIITLGAAFGVLSGRGAFIGMFSTSVIALIMAIFGGTKYGISSPTGPMTAAIAVILLMDAEWLTTHSSELSAVELMNLTLVFAAIFLFVLTVLRIHKLITYVPNLVVSGFVNGIALLIIIAQIGSLDGYLDLMLMFLTFAVAFVSPVKTTLLTILFMSVLANLSGLEFAALDLSGMGESLSFALPAFGALDFSTLWIVLPLALELALIVLLDTLLTAVIMDKRSRTKSNFVKELSGQSVSLLAVSSFGGIPGAQSTVPSVMMEQEKINHPSGKFLIAAFCIVITFLLEPLIAFVPKAVFGGVILKIAYDIADFTSLKTLVAGFKYKRLFPLFILVGTVLSTVLISLNLAVIAFTFLFAIWNRIMPKKLRIKDLVPGKESEGVLDEI